jgi:hypothetical protein
VLERAVERLEKEGHRTPRLDLARAVERAAEDVLRRRHPDRPLRANVEFYTAVLLDALGLPREAFSPLFACGRVVGWLAHVDEQRRTGGSSGPSPATWAVDRRGPLFSARRGGESWFPRAEGPRQVSSAARAPTP